MKTKTIIFISAAVIVLSTTLAFRSNSTLPKNTIAKEEKVASSTNNGGFALKDQDQWK